MSNENFVIDTNQVLNRNSNSNSDPYHNLPADAWVQKQIEYGNTASPSGEGLIEPINELKGKLVGVEIGVCLAHTTESFVKGIKNLKKLYAIDNYPTFVNCGIIYFLKYQAEFVTPVTSLVLSFKK